MARETSQCANGTSFHDTYLYSTVEDLKKLFPNSYSNGDGGYKVHHEFVLETDDGDVFTIYDWKEGYRIPENKEIRFHIGGRNRMVTEQALEELDEIL